MIQSFKNKNMNFGKIFFFFNFVFTKDQRFPIDLLDF